MQRDKLGRLLEGQGGPAESGGAAVRGPGFLRPPLGFVQFYSDNSGELHAVHPGLASDPEIRLVANR